MENVSVVGEPGARIEDKVPIAANGPQRAFISLEFSTPTYHTSSDTQTRP
jgi:hypothetical protein